MTDGQGRGVTEGDGKQEPERPTGRDGGRNLNLDLVGPYHTIRVPHALAVECGHPTRGSAAQTMCVFWGRTRVLRALPVVRVAPRCCLVRLRTLCP